MFKRGVSPLIATVLLVMIVVSIGAAVMVVIQGLSEEQMQNIQTQQDLLPCISEVNLELLRVTNRNRVCVEQTQGGEGSIALYIQNKGTRDIDGWRLTVLGNDGIYTNTFNQELASNNVSGFRFSFSGVATNISGLDRIEINPGIISRGISYCEQSNLIFDRNDIQRFDVCNTTSWDNNILETS